jgi:hypothetical protein
MFGAPSVYRRSVGGGSVIFSNIGPGRNFATPRPRHSIGRVAARLSCAAHDYGGADHGALPGDRRSAGRYGDLAG